MNYFYLSDKEIFWNNILCRSNVDHIYNAWLSEYDSYQYHVLEQTETISNDVEMEKKSFLRHLTASIFFSLDDENCALFIEKMIRDQKRSLFTGHFLLYLLENEVSLINSLLPVLQIKEGAEPPPYMLLHSITYPNDVITIGNTLAVSSNILKKQKGKISAIDVLKFTDYSQNKFKPKTQSLYAIIELFRYNITFNKMWSQIVRNKLINDMQMIRDRVLFQGMVDKGLFLDDVCKETSRSIKNACIDFTSLHGKGDDYEFICQTLEMHTPKNAADALFMIYKEISSNTKRGITPDIAEMMRLCQDALSKTEHSHIINDLSSNETMSLACDYYNISPVDVLNMSNNPQTSCAALKNMTK